MTKKDGGQTQSPS